MQSVSKLTFFSLYATICLIWGSTWLVIRLGTDASLPPFAAASMRFFLATTLLWSFVLYKKIALPRSRSSWGAVILIGFLTNGLQFGIVYWASRFIPSGLEAVIFGTMPLFTAVIAHYHLPGDHLTRTRITGIIIGVIGIATIFLPQFSEVRGEALGPMVLIVIAPMLGAVSAVITKKKTHDIPAVTLNAVTTVVGAVLLGIVSLASEPLEKIQLTQAQIGPVLYLAIIGTIVTFGIYFKLIKMTSAVTMSFVSVITPAIAVILGWIVLGEKLDAYEISGSTLVLVGTAISLRM
ncbi:MAG TPA: EamA family transporter [Candidatus Kapabacteria bacterium]|nr:EamA family transporter [Candidatus Kapabacteria bacterium]